MAQGAQGSQGSQGSLGPWESLESPGSLEANEKLEGELYGEPSESQGAKGKNCQTPIPFLASDFNHCLAGSPKLPQTGLSGKADGCSKTPIDRASFLQDLVGI